MWVSKKGRQLRRVVLPLRETSNTTLLSRMAYNPPTVFTIDFDLLMNFIPHSELLISKLR